MRGLILKDIYQLKSYSRVFIVVFLFAIMGFFSEQAVFMTYYPGIILGMMPITMYAYDEKAKFFTLLSALPVKKETYVSAKYLFGLLLIGFACVLTGIVQAIQMIAKEIFVFSDFAMIMGLALAIGLVAPAVVLPFIFIFGTEKGRFVNIITVGLCVGFINISMEMGNDFYVIIDAKQMIFLIISAAMALYALSWLITAKIFEKKDF